MGLEGWLTPNDGRQRAPVVTLLLIMLIANAFPAFVVLSSVPGKTERWFVWTIHPTANARVLAAMYGSAFLLAAFSWFAGSWALIRSAMVVVVPFSIAATLVTFVTLDPFLKHPWYELTYWLVNYLILFVTALLAFVANERAAGGRLPVLEPLATLERGALALVGCGLGLLGVTLLFQLSFTDSLWPFEITPLVSRILGVWFGSLGAAHLWAAWDGDRVRARPILFQAPFTAVLLAIAPLVHHGDLRNGAAGVLAAYLVIALAMGVVGVVLYPRRHGLAPLGRSLPSA